MIQINCHTMRVLVRNEVVLLDNVLLSMLNVLSEANAQTVHKTLWLQITRNYTKAAYNDAITQNAMVLLWQLSATWKFPSRWFRPRPSIRKRLTKLTLWMLGNFLKIDYIVVCFLNLNSAWFLQGMIDWVANRLDLRPAAELLGGWPGSNLFA